jgi:hypothetical protein
MGTAFKFILGLSFLILSQTAQAQEPPKVSPADKAQTFLNTLNESPDIAQIFNAAQMNYVRTQVDVEAYQNLASNPLIQGNSF